MTSIEISHWSCVDSGINSASHHMNIDKLALENMLNGHSMTPQIRFFQWREDVITYGYLLDSEKVKEWAKHNGNLPIVQRPSGGGAVVHTAKEVALSLLWPRKQGLLPEHPRDCYAAIHAALSSGIEAYYGNVAPSLYVRPDQSCEAEISNGQRFSICFESPVCNDVMINNRKIIGGALRVTRKAILYQGAVQLHKPANTASLKIYLKRALLQHLQPELSATHTKQ